MSWITLLVIHGETCKQKEATTAFDMQARQIEGLIAAGEQSATGRRGKSQAQNIGSVLAEVGRSQAQLSDSIRRSRTQAEASISYATRNATAFRKRILLSRMLLKLQASVISISLILNVGKLRTRRLDVLSV